MGNPRVFFFTVTSVLKRCLTRFHPHTWSNQAKDTTFQQTRYDTYCIDISLTSPQPQKKTTSTTAAEWGLSCDRALVSRIISREPEGGKARASQEGPQGWKEAEKRTHSLGGSSAHRRPNSLSSSGRRSLWTLFFTGVGAGYSFCCSP